MIGKSLTLALLATVVVAGAAQARDQIRIVGSSTVYPFSTRVAEEFGRTTTFDTPVVESTGTGGGFKLFCDGVGVDTADISNASRAIKKSEVENCAKNGVKEITEVKIGYDGIVLANSKAAPRMNITLGQLYLALAKDIPDGRAASSPTPTRSGATSIPRCRRQISRFSARHQLPGRAMPSPSWRWKAAATRFRP